MKITATSALDTLNMIVSQSITGDGKISLANAYITSNDVSSSTEEVINNAGINKSVDQSEYSALINEFKKDAPSIEESKLKIEEYIKSKQNLESDKIDNTEEVKSEGSELNEKIITEESELNEEIKSEDKPEESELNEEIKSEELELNEDKINLNSIIKDKIPNAINKLKEIIEPQLSQNNENQINTNQSKLSYYVFYMYYFDIDTGEQIYSATDFRDLNKYDNINQMLESLNIEDIDEYQTINNSIEFNEVKPNIYDVKIQCRLIGEDAIDDDDEDFDFEFDNTIIKNSEKIKESEEEIIESDESEEEIIKSKESEESEEELIESEESEESKEELIESDESKESEEEIIKSEESKEELIESEESKESKESGESHELTHIIKVLDENENVIIDQTYNYDLNNSSFIELSGYDNNELLNGYISTNPINRFEIIDNNQLIQIVNVKHKNKLTQFTPILIKINKLGENGLELESPIYIHTNFEDDNLILDLNQYDLNIKNAKLITDVSEKYEFNLDDINDKSEIEINLYYNKLKESTTTQVKRIIRFIDERNQFIDEKEQIVIFDGEYNTQTGMTEWKDQQLEIEPFDIPTIQNYVKEDEYLSAIKVTPESEDVIAQVKYFDKIEDKELNIQFTKNYFDIDGNKIKNSKIETIKINGQINLVTGEEIYSLDELNINADEINNYNLYSINIVDNNEVILTYELSNDEISNNELNENILLEFINKLPNIQSKFAYKDYFNYSKDEFESLLNQRFIYQINQLRNKLNINNVSLANDEIKHDIPMTNQSYEHLGFDLPPEAFADLIISNIIKDILNRPDQSELNLLLNSNINGIYVKLNLINKSVISSIMSKYHYDFETYVFIA